jgi:branched-subunit amino acid aminotransferase/4-amino-4-deoxychorismate lyase
MDVANQNLALLDGADELSLSMGVTAGDSNGMGPDAWGLQSPATHRLPTKSRLVIYGYRLPVETFQHGYLQGLTARVVSIRELPADSLDRRLKSRSRLHYWLAEQEARAIQAEAKAILLDAQGNLAEGSTGAVAILDASGNQVVAPEAEQILPSTTLPLLEQVATAMKMRIVRRSISYHDLLEAREVVWLSTPVICQAVVEIDACKIGDGRPGPLYHQVMEHMTELLGTDVRVGNRNQ